MAYITLANAEKIVFNVNIKSLDLTGNIYKQPIYFFSKYEENCLLAIKEFLKNPEFFFNEIYVPVALKDTCSFVYEGNEPAYHNKNNCPLLLSDYLNYEIPEAIKEQGFEAVKIFRRWFKENEYLLDKPDVFVMRLELAWGIRTHPNSIKKENSGSIEKENYNLAELEKTIDSLIKKAGKYYYACTKNTTILKRFSKYTHIAYINDHIKNNYTGYKDEEIKSFLKDYYEQFKKPLKSLLIEYFRLKLNPELKFEGYLLEQLNFKPCRMCNELHK